MKQKFILRIIILMFLVSAVSTVSACHKKAERFSVVYKAAEGGHIEGKTEQSVLYGESAEAVTAVPNEGYEFAGWSDEVTTATRRDNSVTAVAEYVALFRRITSSVSYTADIGGYIEGKTEQSVLYGESAEAVTAVPNEGYEFAGWSDGAAMAARRDENVTADINATAKFDKLERTFIYNYRNATGNNTEESVRVAYEGLRQTAFAVPQKEHSIFGGWYLDSEYNIRVSDELGNILVGNEIFDCQSNYLYAKWTAERQATYKVLMVFVTEIHAVIQGISVDYAMSETERQICALIPEQMSKYLNDWFYGLVKFEVDMYFTTVAVGNESFTVGYNGFFRNDFIMANNIPEISEMIENYGSVITTFCLNDYNNILHNVGGTAETKYAACYLETVLNGLLVNEIPIETIFDIANSYWEFIMEHYLHEFTHTVEMGLDVYGFHEALGYRSDENNRPSNLEITKLYLLNQIVMNSRQVGIPYDFWVDELKRNGI